MFCSYFKSILMSKRNFVRHINTAPLERQLFSQEGIDDIYKRE